MAGPGLQVDDGNGCGLVACTWSHQPMMPCEFVSRWFNWYSGVLSGNEDNQVRHLVTWMQYGALWLQKARSLQREHILRAADENPELRLTHALFVDCDMTWPLNSVDRLLSHDKDIVSGRCHSKQPPYYSNARVWGADGTLEMIEDPPEDGLTKVDMAGFGFILIKIDVLRNVPDNCFWAPPEHPDLSEDISFCYHAGKAGYEVWYDWGLDIAHWHMMPITRAAARGAKTAMAQVEKSRKAAAQAQLLPWRNRKPKP